MKIPAADFDFVPCTEKDLARILEIQDNAFLHLESPELLRKNTTQMFLECLQAPNLTLGAWHQNRLIAFSVLYYVKDPAECLAKELEGIRLEGLASANYKLCIVEKDFWGNSLQYELALRLLRRAVENHTNIVCATASPNNIHSITNIQRLGFSYNRTLTKYGYQRNLYYKILE